MAPDQGPQPLPQILNVTPYKGGEAKTPGHLHPTKLSSNENPFGASANARAAYAAAAENLHIYPDGAHAALREAIAARYGFDGSRIVCGAGSDEIFFLLARAYLAPGDEIVVTEHAFSIYAIAATQSGAVTRVAANRAMVADADAMLSSVTEKTKIVFIANPNNPTGTYMPYAELQRLHAGLPKRVMLVIDAAYAEYVERDDYAAGDALVSQYENVVMTRTFSKIHGLAAARLGWAYAPASVVDALNRTRGPFNVSSAAMLAGVAALEDREFEQASIAHNSKELTRVNAALEELGLGVTPSFGNFVLVHFAPGRAGAADAHLRSHGLIVRGVSSYGLPDALRITIGLVENNDRVIAALTGFMANEGAR